MAAHDDVPARDGFDELRQELQQRSPAFVRTWNATAAKRSVALSLIGLRRAAGLTQAQLAARAGWDKAFLSRLESPLGSVPSAATISRYAEACGASASLAFTIGGEVVEVAALSAEA